jgi:hypothetical protein
MMVEEHKHVHVVKRAMQGKVQNALVSTLPDRKRWSD